MTFQHYPQAQSKFEIPLRLGNNIILEGEVIVTDVEGKKVIGKPGDVSFFPKGMPFTFDTPDYVLAFIVIQRPPLQALKR
ncbi:hypothetical protein CEP54_010115 [Fusarium duplospermum]|uniref:(S)-ureidoglycine aminohydrolase cupin domain-containing protein n=1 Tax=Fusarium duplospermum TaxID=1325734 RepID=A0A428PM19_9HYPO|nr:hypothetical protein CEP54_010115 [Fusarium duplospermum]